MKIWNWIGWYQGKETFTYAFQQVTRILYVSLRVEFYESCVDQLKKDIPKYLDKLSELEKSHKIMAKSMRNVASSEPNRRLQNMIFLYSKMQDVLEKQALSFNLCDKQVNDLIDESLNFLVAPIKVTSS